MTRVAAAIPALDAAGTIDAVVRATRRQLPEVLVVDDGSRDATTARASSRTAATGARAPRCAPRSPTCSRRDTTRW